MAPDAISAWKEEEQARRTANPTQAHPARDKPRSRSPGAAAGRGGGAQPGGATDSGGAERRLTGAAAAAAPGAFRPAEDDALIAAVLGSPWPWGAHWAEIKEVMGTARSVGSISKRWERIRPREGP